MDNLPTRNQNPGDLKDPATGQIRSFSDPNEGKAALYNDLTAKMTGKSKTGLTPDSSLIDFSKTYAPASDNNDPIRYAANLSNKLGVSPDTKIGSLLPRIDDFAGAISQNEGYQGSQSSSQSTQPKSGGQPDWLTALEGLGVGGLGWLTGHVGTVAKTGLPLAGAAIGSAVEPGIGTVVGESLGAAAANAIPGENTSNPNVPQDQSTPQVQNAPLDQEIPKSAMASDLVKNAINQTLGTTQSNRTFSQSPEGQQSVNTAAQYGLITPDEQGNLIFNEEKRQGLLKNLAEGEKKLVSAEGGEGKISRSLELANEYIDKDKFLTPNEKQDAKERVIKEAQGYGSLKGTLPYERMVQGRHEQYAATGGKYNMGKTSSQITAHKALAHGFRNTVAENFKDNDLYNRLLKEEQNLIKSKDLKKKLNGRRPPKENGLFESILRQGARAAEIYIGDKLGGPIGAIVAGIAGEHLNRRITQKYGRNIFETKGMKAAMDILKDTKPEMYKKLVEELEKQGNKPEVDKSKVPGSKGGLIKDIKKDLSKIKQKKGLVAVGEMRRRSPVSF